MANAVHIALGVRIDGTKEVLGLWLEQNEGAKFWLRVMNELRNRGVEDVLLAVVDGLKGFPEAITAVFPDAMVQTCIVHLLRHSLDFVSYKDRKPVAAALKEIYKALDADAGRAALDAFEAGDWGRRYPAIVQIWRRAWPEVIPFYGFAEDVRRIIYTTNSIEAPERQAAPRCPRPKSFPQRRRRDQAPVPRLEQGRERVDHAPKGMGHGQGPVRRHLRRTLHPGDGLMISRPPAHGIPDSPAGLHGLPARALAPDRLDKSPRAREPRDQAPRRRRGDLPQRRRHRAPGRRVRHGPRTDGGTMANCSRPTTSGPSPGATCPLRPSPA